MYISVSLQHNAHLLCVLSSIFSLSSFWLSPIVVHLLFCLDVALSSLHETLHSPVLMLSTSFLSSSFYFHCCMRNLRNPVGKEDGIEFSFLFFTPCVSQSQLLEDSLTRCTFARFNMSCGMYSSIIIVAIQGGWRHHLMSPRKIRNFCPPEPLFYSSAA